MSNPNNKKEQDPLAPEAVTPESDSNTGQEEVTQGQTQSESADTPSDPTMDYPKVVETLRAELDQMKDQAMRALAEAENTRRRAQKDREDASKFAVSGFAKDLLSVADNLRRGLEAVPQDLIEDVRMKNLLDGIEATERELLKTFEKNGIEKLNPKDRPFDPNFHEVLFESPVPGVPAGTVIEVIEVGYALNGRILRPARVGVAKDDGSGPATPPSGEPGANIDTEA